jgi:SAM-dependent methyltransferase
LSDHGATRSRGHRKGSSAQERQQWRAVYEKTPYDELPWFDPGPSASVKLAVASGLFPRKAAVLDVGCGAGSNVLFLAEHGYRSYGIDLSPGAVAAARARAERAHLSVEIEEGDALDLPFADGHLDGVVDHGCFHALPILRRKDYAEQVYRVLRPAGHFVLAWVAREHTGDFGPPHRPSLNEVTGVFEPRFQFLKTGFQPPSEETGPASYFAFLARRSVAQPPPR